MAYKQQKFISPSFRGWEVQHQGGPAESVDLLSDSQICLLTCLALLLKGTNPMQKGSILMTQSPPKGHTSRHHDTGCKDLTFEFGLDTKTQHRAQVKAVPTWKTQDVSNLISLSSYSTLGLSQDSANSHSGTSIQRWSHEKKWGVILKYSLPLAAFTQSINDGSLIFTPKHLLKPVFPCLSRSTSQSSLAWSPVTASFPIYLSSTASSISSLHTTLHTGLISLL